MKKSKKYKRYITLNGSQWDVKKILCTLYNIMITFKYHDQIQSDLNSNNNIAL